MAPYDASKAGVEHVANALRLQVAHHCNTVGCAHVSWIDTPLVQDTNADLPSFRTEARLPTRTAEQHHVGAGVRQGVRQGHRTPQGVHLLPAVGGQLPPVNAFWSLTMSESRPACWWLTRCSDT